MSDNPHLVTARAAYGRALPDWIEVLALQCGRSSQRAVAEALGRSTAVVSQVLSNKYTADKTRIEERGARHLSERHAGLPRLG